MLSRHNPAGLMALSFGRRSDRDSFRSVGRRIIGGTSKCPLKLTRFYLKSKWLCTLGVFERPKKRKKGQSHGAATGWGGERGGTRQQRRTTRTWMVA